uniref:Branched chain amino acid transporter (LIV-II) n=1 Tax=mine drainage metagenome TaxID=410659 RepID=E6QG40_9ZZZZ
MVRISLPISWWDVSSVMVNPPALI